MTTFEITDAQVLDDIHVDRRWNYWNRRGRGGIRERFSYRGSLGAVAFLAIEAHLAQGSTQPIADGAALHLVGHWPPLNGLPSSTAWPMIPAICRALRDAQVVTGPFLRVTCETHVGSAPLVVVTVQPYEGP